MNSIEEDIDILEIFLKICDEDLFTEISIKTNGLTRNAIEHLIKAYKELEENINKQKQLTKIAQTITDESIKEALIEFEKDYIPVSLVEEKIEELKEEIEQLRIEKNVTYDSGIYRNRIKLETLQELLEKR